MVFNDNTEKKFIHIILTWFSRTWLKYFILNIGLIFAITIYILLRYEYLNPMIPFFYTKPWGDAQLADKSFIFVLPALALAINLITQFFYRKARKYYWSLMDNALLMLSTFTTLIIVVSAIRIIYIASSPFEPLIEPEILNLITPFLIGLVLTIIGTPRFIAIFKKFGIITNPSVHNHPSMILTKPSARGGGLVFTFFFIFTAWIFIGITEFTKPIFVGSGLLALLGILDDYQNTNIKTKISFLENPLIRLGALFIIVLIPILMGIRIDSINNPFNGSLQFGQYEIEIMGYTLKWVSIIFTSLWIVWVLNVLSWSNGVDGQYGGIVGIALIVIAILALRFEPLELMQLNTAKMVAIASGVAFGITYYNWYPSKIMWGFGAMTAGLVISGSSILVEGKIATSIIIILIPFIDAVVIFFRRLIQGKFPFKGDRGHLHHLLMERGWGVRRIATFYWLTTIIMGGIVIYTANKDRALLLLTISGLVGFALLALHITATKTYQLRHKDKTDE